MKALLLRVGDAMWPDVEAQKSTPEIERMGRGPWTEEQESWVGKHKAQEIFIYVIISPRTVHPFIQA